MNRSIAPRALSPYPGKNPQSMSLRQNWDSIEALKREIKKLHTRIEALEKGDK